ncbi:hypothetical protein GLGCALEP_04714 [Pseudomonas sp. MM221]|nr:hypothetical protein GLGCALEP_04714 [Pseudomonas sp. MM221]
MTHTTSTTFAHPGLLNSQARLHDFASKANSTEPSAIKAGYEAMLKEKYASLGYPFQPYAIIEVLPGELTPTEKQFKEDSAAAYVLALRWVQSNDPRYRDRAIEILDGWASTYQRMNSPKSTVQPCSNPPGPHRCGRMQQRSSSTMHRVLPAGLRTRWPSSTGFWTSCTWKPRKPKAGLTATGGLLRVWR